MSRPWMQENIVTVAIMVRNPFFKEYIQAKVQSQNAKRN